MQREKKKFETQRLTLKRLCVRLAAATSGVIHSTSVVHEHAEEEGLHMRDMEDELQVKTTSLSIFLCLPLSLSISAALCHFFHPLSTSLCLPVSLSVSLCIPLPLCLTLRERACVLRRASPAIAIEIRGVDKL